METFRVGVGMRIEDVTTGDCAAAVQLVAVTPGIDAITVAYAHDNFTIKNGDWMEENARFAAESDDEITPSQLD